MGKILSDPFSDYKTGDRPSDYKTGDRSFLTADGRRLTRMQDWIIRLGFDVFGIILFL
jgi:hypothetical protein